MSRKSLFFGSIVLILAMLFALAGCKDPVAGPQGPQGDQGKQGDKGNQGNTVQGPPGGGGLSGPVTAVDLEIAFENSDEVILLSNVTTVYGVVPANKKLIVLGDATIVSIGEELALESGAVLEVHQDAILTATNLGGVLGSGRLTAAAGAKVEGDGTVILPVDLSVPPNGPYTGSLHWESPEVTTAYKYPGSAYEGIPIIRPDVADLTSADIGNIFTLKNKDELTVLNVRNLEPTAIPAGKKLTLVGTGNTITTAAFTLINNARLTVGPGGVLTLGTNGGATAFQSNSDAVFTNEGTVTLTDDGAGNSSSIRPNGGVITNNNIITSLAEEVAIIEPLLAATGTGTIVLNSAGDVGFTNTPIPLNQYLVLGGGPVRTYTLGDVARPFIGFAANKTITIDNGVTLILPDDVEAIGTRVYNNGTIQTATVLTSVLSTIFAETGNQGAVEANGEVEDDITNGAFTIPQGISLELSNANTELVYIGGVILGFTPSLVIEGTLNVNANAALVPAGNITIGGTVILTGTSSLTVAAAQTLTIASSASFSGGGTLEQEDATSIIVINGETGYELDVVGGGVVGNNYADALLAITQTRSLLTDNVPTAGAPYPQWTAVPNVVGTVEVSLAITSPPAPVGILAGAPHPVYASNTAAGLLPIVLPANTAVVNTVLAALDGAFSTTDAFTLAVDNAAASGYGWALTLADAGPLGPTDKFGVLRFNSYQVSNSNLISPVLTDLFHIGVKSKR